ncbi:MAG: proton-conducting transporter membrane subunit, partial [Bradyrhizobium sp.]|nr:proton-conducting transporter membrane subunit [Bradyrhizobium sp.]
MMTSSLWLAMSGPAALLAASLLPAIKPDLSQQAVNRMAAVASGVAGAAAFATAIGVATSGALHTPALAISGIGFGLYLDSVSATMFCLVSFIGAIVLRYSFTYMDGDPGQIRFIRLMCLTLAAVLTLAISGNLLQFTLAWSATSLALHRLLVFYAERPAAVIAARKKFLASRLGDLFLVAAMLLLYAAFGSLDYESMFSAAQAMRGQGAIPLGVQIAAVLMVFAGLLKSAQFPVHG